MSLFSQAKKGPFALIILNNALPIISNGVIDHLWSTSQVKICSDGGANRLKAYNSNWIPNYIVGDFDSVHVSTLEYYKEKCAEIIKISETETADVEKCILHVANTIPKISKCIIYGFSGGIVDKELNCYHLLAKWNKQMPLVLYDEWGWAMLLGEGENSLELDTEFDGPRCGLIPLYCETNCTTEGFTWNLRERKLKMGDFISTSNRFAFEGKGKVKVFTDNKLLFTCQIKKQPA